MDCVALRTHSGLALQRIDEAQRISARRNVLQGVASRLVK
jgi:hypothetical protein